MRVDGLTIALRPRPMAEAADLGVLMVHRHARSLWRCYLPVLAAATVLALAALPLGAWAPGLLLFWLKPWLDRTLLFVLSRAAFGQETRWADVWARRGSVLGGRLLSTLLWRRLSFCRAYTQPAEQLEGQRGPALAQRNRQLTHGRLGAAMGAQWVFGTVETILLGSAMALAAWLAPQGYGDEWLRWIRQLDPQAGAIGGTLLYALVMALVEPFYVAAGFAMYLNRRVELEAWDIEQEFRRAFG